MKLNKETIISEMDYFGLPSYMQEGVINYVLYHLEPGDFLYAVLNNNLSLAVQKADHVNSKLLKEWVCFVYNVFPMAAWGSSDAVRHWLQELEQEVTP